jgi:hypothetical protein
MNSREATPFIKDYRKCAVFMKNTVNFVNTYHTYNEKMSVRQAVGDRENSGEQSSKEMDSVIMGQPTPQENYEEYNSEESDDLVLSDSDDSAIAKISGREAVGDRENSGEQSSKEIVKEYNKDLEMSIQQLPFISIISFTRNDELFLCVKTESLFTEIM